MPPRRGRQLDERAQQSCATLGLPLHARKTCFTNSVSTSPQRVDADRGQISKTSRMAGHLATHQHVPALRTDMVRDLFCPAAVLLAHSSTGDPGWWFSGPRIHYLS